MPRALVTPEAVATAADALAAAGEEPTIIRVQEQIGVGSYTTVKRFLDEWRAARAAGGPAPVEIPAEIAARGTEFVAALWQAAASRAEQQVTQVRAESESQVTEARARLSEAERTIERLETEVGEAERAIERQAEASRQQEQALAEARTGAQTANARAGELERHAEDLRTQVANLLLQLTARDDELRAAQQRTEAALIERARLEGEVEALRRLPPLQRRG